MDHGEGVEHGIDDIDNHQEKRGGRQHGQRDRPEPLDRPRAVDGCRLAQAGGDGLQARDEEQEVIADLLPRGGNHHQDHRIACFQRMVPVIADHREHIGKQADRRVEHEPPHDPGDGRGDRVGPDQQRGVNRCAADHAVHRQRKDQRDPQRKDGHRDGKHQGNLQRVQVIGVLEQRAVVGQTDEQGLKPESILPKEGLPDRLTRGPKEKDRRYSKLGE
ncbi:hypothetical protein GALL_490080 [mine drainage metagenome]|uniref:Uncharacterized protein n=1 Tax=mine drainage metagenome TaxID=410659 RepID=A0A1J5PNQ0_9ZZZZ